MILVGAARGKITLALICLVALTGCVSPSRTDADYRHKLNATAGAVKSQVELVILACEGDRAAKSTEAYTSVLIAEASDDAGSIAAAFGTVQPPSATADELRTTLLAILSDTTDALDSARILARRGQARSIEIDPLKAASKKLDDFVSEHPA